MTNAIDDAIARLQDIALSSTDVTIKSAPDYPIENADPAPFSIAYLADGNGTATAAGLLSIVNIAVEFYFSAVNLKKAYQQMDLVALEFMRRLAGDPSLNSKVATIIFTDGQHPTYENLGIAKWGTVDLHLLKFTVPVKFWSTPITA